MGCFLSMATIPAYAGTSLGSTSVLQKSGEAQHLAGSLARYRPFGSYRTAPTQTITDRDFTGQRENRELGLLYYNARFYHPGIGRFISPDTLIPNPSDPQSFNRYAYVFNRPVNLVDPSGHIACSSSNLPGQDQAKCSDAKPTIPTGTMVTFTGDNWSNSEKGTVSSAARTIGARLAKTLNEQHPSWHLTPAQAFKLTYGGSVAFNKTGTECAEGCWGRSTGANGVNIYNDAGDITGNSKFIIHELGHSFESRVNGALEGSSVRETLEADTTITRRPDNGDGTYGFAGTRYGWQQSPEGTPGEEFADMYIGWTYDQWQTTSDANGIAQGVARSSFMATHMPLWVDLAANQ